MQNINYLLMTKMHACLKFSMAAEEQTRDFQTDEERLNEIATSWGPLKANLKCAVIHLCRGDDFIPLVCIYEYTTYHIVLSPLPRHLHSN